MITSHRPAWLETRLCLGLRQHGLKPVYLVQCLFLLCPLFLCVAYSCAVVDEKRSHHWCDTLAKLVEKFAASVADNGGKFAAGVVDTGGNLPPVSTLIPLPNLPPVSTTLAKLVEKFAAGVVDTGSNFAAGVVDTGGKFATGVVDTGGAP